MAEIPLQSSSVRKLALDLTRNAAAADTAQVGSNKKFIVQNTSGVTRTVTVNVPGTDPINGGAKLDLIETVLNGEFAIIPLLEAYGDPTLSGMAAISYDNVTGLKVAAVAFA
jgi:hypothetical protein